jgi:hypothetical protein
MVSIYHAIACSHPSTTVVCAANPILSSVRLTFSLRRLRVHLLTSYFSANACSMKRRRRGTDTEWRRGGRARARIKRMGGSSSAHGRQLVYEETNPFILLIRALRVRQIRCGGRMRAGHNNGCGKGTDTARLRRRRRTDTDVAPGWACESTDQENGRIVLGAGQTTRLRGNQSVHSLDPCSTRQADTLRRADASGALQRMQERNGYCTTAQN